MEFFKRKERKPSETERLFQAALVPEGASSVDEGTLQVLVSVLIPPDYMNELKDSGIQVSQSRSSSKVEITIMRKRKTSDRMGEDEIKNEVRILVGHDKGMPPTIEVTKGIGEETVKEYPLPEDPAEARQRIRQVIEEELGS